jgi:two-component system, LuxR family, sensor histidine kinase DctS
LSSRRGHWEYFSRPIGLLRGGRSVENSSPLILFLALVLFVLLSWQEYVSINENAAKQKNLIEAKALKKAILQLLVDRSASLLRMGDRWEAAGRTRETPWRRDAAQYLKHYPSYLALGYADSTSVVKWLEPPLAVIPKPVVGFQISSEKKRNDAVQRSMVSKKPEFTKSISLRHGGQGFLEILAVYHSGIFDGYIFGTSRYSDFFRTFQYPDQAPGQALHFNVLEDGELIYTTINSGVSPNAGEDFRGLRETLPVEFGGVSWELQVETPRESRFGAAYLGSWLFLLVGLVFAGLGALLLKYYIHAKIATQQSSIRALWLRAIVDGTRLSIISTDPRGIIRTFNPAAERLLQYCSDEVIGHKTPQIWHDPQEVILRAEHLSRELGVVVEPGFKVFVKKAELGIVEELPWTYIARDGSRHPVTLAVHALVDPGGEIYGYVGIAENLTDRVRLEQELEAQKVRSAHNLKMASLGELAAAVAHEINNPLAIISALAASLPSKASADESVFQIRIQKIQRACERVAKIVSGLKKFSRTNPRGERRIVSAKNVVAESLALVELSANRHGVKVISELQSQSKISCDEIEIEQVLINIMTNAVEATKSEDERWVKLHLFDRNSLVIIQVTNSGPPISSEIADRIFEPFFTTKAVSGDGTGLGLSISNGIVKEHGGTIQLVRNSKNTCFEVSLPAVRIGAISELV